jgi:hypothetical protein
VRRTPDQGTSIAGATRTFTLQYAALNTVSAKLVTTLPTCTG